MEKGTIYQGKLRDYRRAYEVFKETVKLDGKNHQVGGGKGCWLGEIGAGSCCVQKEIVSWTWTRTCRYSSE